MELTKFSDYSLRLLIYLGAHRDRVVAISEVANAYGISRNHLVKIVVHLTQLELVQTIRGQKGGIRLAKEPSDINIGILIRQTEASLSLLECFDPATNTCRIAPCCALKGIMKRALAAFFHELDKHSLADLLGDPRRLRELLRSS